MALKRGALIVFEGVDRCGKSTQTKMLVDALNATGHPTVYMRFPERTTDIGKIINEYLSNARNVDDNAVHLLFSANRWELKGEIEKTLNEGKSIVVDRYAYSGVAFTSAKGLDFDWCKTPDCGLPRPDLVLYLSISVEDAMKRGDFGQERYEKADFQRKVKSIFEEKLMKLDPREHWVQIDATKSIADIHSQIRALAEDCIQKAASNPIGTLWI